MEWKDWTMPLEDIFAYARPIGLATYMGGLYNWIRPMRRTHAGLGVMNLPDAAEGGVWRDRG